RIVLATASQALLHLPVGLSSASARPTVARITKHLARGHIRPRSVCYRHHRTKAMLFTTARKTLSAQPLAIVVTRSERHGVRARSPTLVQGRRVAADCTDTFILRPTGPCGFQSISAMAIKVVFLAPTAARRGRSLLSRMPFLNLKVRTHRSRSMGIAQFIILTLTTSRWATVIRRKDMREQRSA